MSEQILGTHEEREHSLLSASSFERVIHCPGSAKKNYEMPDESSSFASEGTKAHEIAEESIRVRLDTGEYPNYEGENKEIFLALYPYLERVFNTKMSLGENAVLYPETRVYYDNYAQGGFGTCDVIIIGNGTMYVIDLKFGKGVKVDAVGNPQLRLYAIGALNFFSKLFTIDKVVMRIDQPRIYNFSEEEMTPEELHKWGEEVVKPAAEKALADNAEYIAGDHCKWCKFAPMCPAKAQLETSVMAVAPEMPAPESLTPEQVKVLLTKGTAFKKFIDEVEKYYTNEAINGNVIDGMKLVAGKKGNRKYTNESDVREALKNAGYTENDFEKKSLIGITDMQRLLGGKVEMENILGAYIAQPDGTPILVPEDDPREKI